MILSPEQPPASSACRRHLLAAVAIFALSRACWITSSSSRGGAPSSPSSSFHTVSAFSPPNSNIILPILYGRQRSLYDDRRESSAVVTGRRIVIAHSGPGVESGDTADAAREEPSSTTTTDDDNESSRSSCLPPPPPLPNPDDMRLREMQSELREMEVSYADCFDRESLARRLMEARDGSAGPSSGVCAPPETNDSRPDAEERTAVAPEETTRAPPAAIDDDRTTIAEAPEEEEFDRESTLIRLRSLRVKELRVELSKFKVRWGTMIEKEEMVTALCDAMEDLFRRSRNFSRSGRLVPGTVADVEEETLMEELGWLESDVGRGVATTGSAGDDTSAPHPPILLDVYATWCGPCKFLAPLLIEAAEELGPSVRMIKLDSDKYPRISSVLKVGGLPTLIRFDGGDVSKEVQRVEGALTKDQIIDFVNGDFRR